jgi:hypothetical protein
MKYYIHKTVAFRFYPTIYRVCKSNGNIMATHSSLEALADILKHTLRQAGEKASEIDFALPNTEMKYELEVFPLTDEEKKFFLTIFLLEK